MANKLSEEITNQITRESEERGDDITNVLTETIDLLDKLEPNMCIYVTTSGIHFKITNQKNQIIKESGGR